MVKLSQLTEKQRGFTLAEMAIVVVIAGILVTMGLKMTMANLTNAAYASTKSKQAQIKIALINYLRTNGKLPCPDMTVAPAAPTGTAAAACAGAAVAGYGILPWLTLNISRDTAIDGWGNFFFYRVANGLPSTQKNWTTNINAASFDIGQLNTPSAAITVRQRDPVTGLTTITTNAVAVILSGGNNGYRMRTQQGPLNSAVPAADLDETTNITAAGNTFVIGPYSDVIGVGGGPFDDVVSYLVPQDLLQPLVAEQFIANCRSYCAPCTAAGVPYAYCLAANNPAVPTGSCTVALPTQIPVGNPDPVCP